MKKVLIDLAIGTAVVAVLAGLGYYHLETISGDEAYQFGERMGHAAHVFVFYLLPAYVGFKMLSIIAARKLA